MPIGLSKAAATVLSGFKTPPTRRIVILLPADDEVDRRANRHLADKVYDDRDLIVNRFDEAVKMLRKLSHRRFPDFRLLFDRTGTRNRTLAELLHHHHAAAGIRAIVDFAVVPPAGKTMPRNAAISHLVSVSIDKEGAFGWDVSDDPADVIVKTTLAKVAPLMQDIALDIAMTHSYRDRLGDALLGPPLSRAKAEFAVFRGLSSYYGDLLDPAIRYFSLAAAIRASAVFSNKDCERYEELWRDFLDWLKQQGHKPVMPSPGPTPLQRAMTSLRRHKRAGQLPFERIEAELSTLPPGEYFLLVAMRAPKDSSLRQRVLALLSMRRWKTNAWHVVSQLEPERLRGLDTYVSVFPLDLEERK